MLHPRQVWLALFACAALVIAAMGWLTHHAVRADRERSQARAAAELEQRISLALWRMDTKLAPLIAEEIARPAAFYEAFLTVQAADGATQQAPSPLMTAPAANVVLNFAATPEGVWMCPQAPAPELESLALAHGLTAGGIAANRSKLDELARSVDVPALLAELPERPLTPDRLGAAPAQMGRFAGGAELRTRGGASSARPLFNSPPGEESLDDPFGDSAEVDNAPPPAAQPAQQSAASVAKSKIANDFAYRNIRYQSAAQEELQKQRGANSYWANAAGFAGESPVTESASRPVWIGDKLLLARRVVRDGQSRVQGSWLDWPRLRADLLAEVGELLPGADLAPVRRVDQAEPARMLAGLPVRLVVPASLASAAGRGVEAPLRWALGAGWAAIVMALAALGLLLWGVLALSERRAAFVSSVTHELRTPLTTFRMYAEMLARDMAPPQRRREYLETLRTEAERLTGLVENVLAYARLERGRKPRAVEATTPAALVARLESRLSDRAGQAGMQWDARVDAAVGDAPLTTDVGVVEQILFNLVDNAAKYAARAADRRITLRVARDGSDLILAVRDHGPGFASLRDAQRSAPFGRSAQEAAESAPGVGLGLALCRRLARELGGRLVLEQAGDAAGGAIATLCLPLGR